MALTGDEVNTILVALERTAIAAVVAIALAIPIGIACGMARISQFWIVRFLVGLYIEVFRGTSALVQLFFAVFVLPELGVRLDPLMAGVGTLALNAAAFVAEIARGAFFAVPAGQTEAAAALNLGWWTRRLTIVLPQAWRTMLPPLGSIAIDVLKGTSLLSIVAVRELTKTVTTVSQIGALTPEEAFLGLFAVYLVLSGPIAFVFAGLEKIANRSFGRGATR